MGSPESTAMRSLRRLAWAALIVTDAGAFLPAPSGRAPLERKRNSDHGQQAWGGRRTSCRVVQPETAAAGRNGGSWRAEERHRSAGALRAVKKGRNAGGQRQRKRKPRAEEEVGRETGQEEDAAEVEAMRLEKLAEWRAMMQSGEVGAKSRAGAVAFKRCLGCIPKPLLLNTFHIWCTTCSCGSLHATAVSRHVVETQYQMGLGAPGPAHLQQRFCISPSCFDRETGTFGRGWIYSKYGVVS